MFSHEDVESENMTINFNENTSSKENTEDIEDYQFECQYCEYNSEPYNPFLYNINTNHLESDNEYSRNEKLMQYVRVRR